MVDGLLMGLEDYNCWSIAEAVGHRGPHRLQHLLSRAVWDDRQVLNAAAAWAVTRLNEEDHQLAKQAAGLDSGQVIRWRSWHRWSALCLLAYICLAVAAASHRDRRLGLETGLIPLTIPELVRLLRDAVIPPPCRDQAHRQYWSRWRRRHQHRASQARRRWHADADATPSLQPTSGYRNLAGEPDIAAMSIA